MPRGKKSIHYVNNAEFSQAVVDYVTKADEAKKSQSSIPVVPDYVAQCFLRIAQGLSHKSNFIRYTYREEMVMDAVENCLKAIGNYDLAAATRTGKPNAFAYFTQISWYAFLRRIAKEKKQQDIKLKYLTQTGIDSFVDGTDNEQSTYVVGAFVETLRDRIDKVRQGDEQFKSYAKQEKEKVKRKKLKAGDSDLDEFMS